MKNEHFIPANVIDLAKKLDESKPFSAENEYLLQRMEAIRDFSIAVIEKNSRNRHKR